MNRVVPAAELFVERCAKAGLIVQNRDGSVRFHIRELMPLFISSRYASRFKPFGEQAHQPRITVDNLGIGRECWCLPCTEVDFSFEKTPAARFAAARRWMARQGMPRWVFLKLPAETKPVYMDFESSRSIEVIAKLIRQTENQDSRGSFSEMLPTPEQCWLSDAQGNRYTSELRTIALAPERWVMPEIG